jgi:hypothetical protein
VGFQHQQVLQALDAVGADDRQAVRLRDLECGAAGAQPLKGVDDGGPGQVAGAEHHLIVALVAEAAAQIGRAFRALQHLRVLHQLAPQPEMGLPQQFERLPCPIGGADGRDAQPMAGAQGIALHPQ